jgi:hypothetical protein
VGIRAVYYLGGALLLAAGAIVLPRGLRQVHDRPRVVKVAMPGMRADGSPTQRRRRVTVEGGADTVHLHD